MSPPPYLPHWSAWNWRGRPSCLLDLPSDTKRKALAVKRNGLYKDSCLTWLSEWRARTLFLSSIRSQREKGIVVPSLTNIDELLRVCPQQLSSSQGCWKTHFYMPIKTRTGSPQKESVNWISATYSVLLAPLVGLVYIHVELVYCSFNKEKRSIVWLYSSPLNYQACPKADTLLFLKAFWSWIHPIHSGSYRNSPN